MTDKEFSDELDGAICCALEEGKINLSQKTDMAVHLLALLAERDALRDFAQEIMRSHQEKEYADKAAFLEAANFKLLDLIIERDAIASKLAEAKADLEEKQSIIKNECEDWAECHTFLQNAGIQMDPVDSYSGATPLIDGIKQVVAQRDALSSKLAEAKAVTQQNP